MPRHNSVVDLITKEIAIHSATSVKIQKKRASRAEPAMFCNSEQMSLPIPPDDDDVNEVFGQIFVLEVDCTFDYSLEEAFFT